jgi:phenylacetate-CoA ligase
LTHHVEILNQNGAPTAPGEVGEIVVTLLTNYAMPLIRYRIGDMGMWADEPCTCGRVWPLLMEITGRTTDNFVTRGGALIYGGFFRQLLFYQDWIKNYQIIQEDYNNININVVLRNNNDSLRPYEDKVSEIKKKITYVMGEDCNIKFNLVKDLEPTPSGKYRYTISKIKK